MDFEKLYKEGQQQILELQKQLNTFHHQLDSLVNQNEYSQKTISALTAQIALLNASIIELSCRLHQDSTNSGKPSSSDPYRKPRSKKK